MINVSKLKKGIVLDHITAGHGYKLFKQLHLDELEDVVVLMKNVDSGKLGKKDLIKIETDMPLDLTVIGLIEPGITISYIENGECTRKLKLRLPEKVDGILTCKNPRCISNVERLENITFYLVDAEKKEYACEYCEARTKL
ncbi:MAG: aspartate carbamoyltransferase regulatory subunit [Eubacteriales bacterium]|nr:aspartate carbamoyltransferase regulatory subunit [Eubacteriales bacterium]MCI7570687.1 aspartate carbamoyltransferase regulatory subunit [Clostridiales bacterium]MDD7550501.1 aspartate carbamoyltransferase regulatory subunit [Clostridia bacterium]MDY5754237.1 aspartate carbamoyltransferase regulatory subunit [Eubacteriales bacterium]